MMYATGTMTLTKKDEEDFRITERKLIRIRRRLLGKFKKNNGN